jgi:hypothetical protein
VSPRRSSARWPLIGLLPLGLGAWAPIYAGLKARRPLWTAIGAAWTIVALVGYGLSAATIDHRHGDTVAGDCLLAAWLGGAVTSFVLRGPYARRTAGLAALEDPPAG